MLINFNNAIIKLANLQHPKISLLNLRTLIINNNNHNWDKCEIQLFINDEYIGTTTAPGYIYELPEDYELDNCKIKLKLVGQISKYSSTKEFEKEITLLLVCSDVLVCSEELSVDE